MQKTDRKSIEWQVLVVDENVEERKALTRCLFSAGSVTDALKILEHEQVDVILSDLRMSEMTGIDMLMRVRVTQPDTTG